MPFPAKTSPEAILRQAVTLLDRDGPDALSMRTLADALHVRPSSLYRHYPDRAALEQAIADHTISELHHALETATRDRTGPDALHAAAHAYLAYARAHPHRYDLMLAPRPPAPATPGPGKQLWNLVLSLLSPITRHPDDTNAAVAFWAFLHGFIALERSGLFGQSGPQHGFDTGLHALTRGLGRVRKPA